MNSAAARALSVVEIVEHVVPHIHPFTWIWDIGTYGGENGKAHLSLRCLSRLWREAIDAFLVRSVLFYDDKTYCRGAQIRLDGILRANPSLFRKIRRVFIAAASSIASQEGRTDGYSVFDRLIQSTGIQVLELGDWGSQSRLVPQTPQEGTLILPRMTTFIARFEQQVILLIEFLARQPMLTTLDMERESIRNIETFPRIFNALPNLRDVRIALSESVDHLGDVLPDSLHGFDIIASRTALKGILEAFAEPDRFRQLRWVPRLQQNIGASATRYDTRISHALISRAIEGLRTKNGLIVDGESKRQWYFLMNALKD